MNPNNMPLDLFLKLMEVALITTTLTKMVYDPPFETVDITSVKIKDMEFFYMVEWEDKAKTKFHTSVEIDDYMRIIRKDKLNNILK